MREIAVGVGVSVFIALCLIYTYQPSLLDTWFRRLFME